VSIQLQPALDATTSLALLEAMLRIRMFEERAAALFAQREITGGLHLSIGQEAAAVGVCAALEDGDYITSTHRGHHHCLARGADPARMMAELMGRRTGYCGGRGGSMHIADPALGILGANGIVGAGLPIAVGAALACQVRGNQRVAICFFGEGATDEGVFHESLNLARLWLLPVVFICENNQYSEMMPASAHMPVTDVASRAVAYDVPGVAVDGNDVAAVHAAASDAVVRARSGLGPTLLEAKTYRWRGHYEGDPQRYRAPGEADHWRGLDPVERWRQHLLTTGRLDDTTWQLIGDRTAAAIDAAVEFARTSPPPEPGDLYLDVNST
jgi:TPP-dependent pyruvate/acetoin dehydrogenase alpha subunit